MTPTSKTDLPQFCKKKEIAKGRKFNVILHQFGKSCNLENYSVLSGKLALHGHFNLFLAIWVEQGDLDCCTHSLPIYLMSIKGLTKKD